MSVSLPSGTRLGRYRIGSRIGRGGMGEIYEADDLGLERRVALKILAPELLDRPDRIQRFVQEAKSASALNHPHILTVYEVGEEQVDGQPVRYIAMELIEGVTLRDEIHARRSPLKRLLDVLGQAADALAKAHAKGIVHRDLKPDNIMVTADGYAKVIDFGLAKLAEPRLAVSSGAETLSLTREGSLLGTVGYMSPEQVERRPADERSDIFSFGCILYEAITRTRAFAASSAVEVLYKIVHDPPPELQSVEHVPDNLRRLVACCLEKAPADRYQSMRDVALDLRAIQQGLSSKEERLRHPTRVVQPGWIAVAATLVISVPTIVWLVRRPSAGEPPQVMEALVRWPSNEWECRISPDGTWVSFLSDRGGKTAIWLRRMAGGEPTLLIGPAQIISHAWSPQSDRIAYLTGGPDKVFLEVAPAFGGPPREGAVIDARFWNGHLIRWIGRSIYIEGSNGLARYDTATHLTSTVVPAMTREGKRVDFDVHSDERNITYSIRQGEREVVWVANIDGTKAVRLTPEGARYSDFRPQFAGVAASEVVLSSDRSGQIDLWRVALTGKSTQQITFSPAIEWVTDVSPDGRRIAVKEERNGSNLWLSDVSNGNLRQATGEAVQDLWPSSAPSARMIAFQRSKATNQTVPYIFSSDIFAATIANGDLSQPRLVVDDGAMPHVSPNGRWLTYVKPPAPPQWELWVKDLRGDHQWRVSSRFKVSAFSPFPLDWLESNVAWTRTGDSVYFVERGEIRRTTPPAMYSELIVAEQPNTSVHDLQISPDDRLLVYVRTPRSPWRSDVIVRDVSSGQERVAFSRFHDRFDRLACKGWRKSGQLVVVQSKHNADQKNHAVHILQIDQFARQTETGLEPHAFPATARLDPSDDSVTLTAVDPRGFHNILRISLADGQKRWLTDNRLPGISFGGVEIVPDHHRLFSRQESNSDLWLISISR